MTAALIPSEQFADLFVNDRPMMDVRAPVEFAQGAFPSSCNLPLLDDDQRHIIGIEYAEKGQDAAIALGESLATPAIREHRLQQWRSFIEAHPDTVLYCFRGGLRSRITQQWLADAGIDIPLVEGGYKALRRFLIDRLDAFCDSQPLCLIAGPTGSGKTELLLRCANNADLEGMAGHRGSTFGQWAEQQPSQIDFENAISVACLKHGQSAPGRPLILEDEGRLIGRLSLPESLREAMAQAPLLILKCPLHEREDRILRDYIIAQRQRFQSLNAATAAESFAEFVLGNLHRIRKRLGGERYQRISAQWEEALRLLEAGEGVEAFRSGVSELLVHYYDPMYEYQLSKREGKVLMRGDADTLLHSDWLSR